MAYELPKLSYEYNALEPHVDARTMEIHHTKHHQGYVTKANAALEGTALDGKPVEEVLKNLDKLPDAKRQAVINNAGGHANHTLFWAVMGPGKGGAPTGALADAVNQSFGSFDKFKDAFTEEALGRFGSGWAWLGFDPSGKLHVCSTANQDSPLMSGHKPILGLDVWEHAYYLNYQNRRPDYVEAWWNVVNWAQVAENFDKAK